MADILDRIVFYDVCFDNFDNDGEGKSDIAATMKDIFSNIGQRILTKKAIMKEEHTLIRLGLVELVGEDEMGLTDKGKEYFYGEDLQAFCKQLKYDNIYISLEKVYEYFHDNPEFDSNFPHSRGKLCRMLAKYENANKHLAEVQKISTLIPDAHDRVLFYSTGQNAVEEAHTSLTYQARVIYPPLTSGKKYWKSLRKRSTFFRRKVL